MICYISTYLVTNRPKSLCPENLIQKQITEAENTNFGITLYVMYASVQLLKLYNRNAMLIEFPKAAILSVLR